MQTFERNIYCSDMPIAQAFIAMIILRYILQPIYIFLHTQSHMLIFYGDLFIFCKFQINEELKGLTS